MASGNTVLAGVLLIVAGIYQFTPLKQACLVRCRAPYEGLVKYWRRGALGPMRAGIANGAFCLGCCWLLMGLLFVGGLMNVLWVAAIALLVLIEKLLPGAPWVSRGTGIALLAWGTVVLLR
jgi:predicted metal-binding membrane protein